jgi:hypothetical protein
MALNPQYMFSPNLQEFFIDADTNLPLTEGFVFYYQDNDRASLKTVYELSGSYDAGYTFTPLPNPLQLGGAGTTVNGAGADIRVYYYPYDVNGVAENYYIRVTDKFGNTKLVRQAWPNLTMGSSAATGYAYNFVRNATFYVWNTGPTTYLDVGTGSNSLTDFMFPDWTYTNDDDSQDIDILQGTFSASDSDVPGNPVNYLIYRNNDPGNATATINAFSQTYGSVKTLSGQNVAASIWIDQTAGSAGQFSLTLTQNFGSGGSASVTTAIIIEPTLVEGNWTLYSGSMPLPSISGKTVLPGNQLILSLNMPLNQAAEIHMTEVLLNEGLAVTTSTEISNDDRTKQTNQIGLYPAWTTGDVKPSLKTTATTGWLLMDDTTIGQPGSGASHQGFAYFPLYDMIWNNVNNNSYAPIFTNAGVLSTYGSSSSADWNLLKPLSLTKVLGRVLAGANPTGVNSFFYYNYAGSGNTLTLVSPFLTTGNIYTGTLIEFNVGAPGGLTPNTPYYAINTGTTTFQVATTQANAVAGIPITLSGGAVVAQPVTLVFGPGPLGSFAGEQTHLQLPATEMPAHAHASGTLNAPLEVITVQAGTGALVLSNQAITTTLNVTAGSTANTGGSTPFNITDPRSYYNVFIKL